MPRLRLYDVRQSRFPEAVQLCSSDVADIAKLANSAERRLMLDRAAGDTGWFGSWARMVFNVDQTNPLLTVPRRVARIINMDLCREPVNIENEFFEFLEFGNGLMPRNLCQGCSPDKFKQVYSRGQVPTFRDIDSTNQFVRVVPTDSTDTGQRVLIQGQDAQGKTVYTQDTLNQVEGMYVVLDFPFVQTDIVFSKITGIQKDITTGEVIVQQADATTGATVTLVTLEPGEMVSGYARYFINGVPSNCCTGSGTPTTVQLTCMAKLEHIDVFADQDYFVLQNLEALIAEAQAIRYSEMDTTAATGKEVAKHKTAIGLLQGELVHYTGQDRPAVEFSPFGSARLSRQRIGSLI